MTPATRTAAKTATRSTAPAPEPIGQQETLEDLLDQSGRGIVPIRKTFVQIGRGKMTKAGPLADFVGRHDRRGLDAYLFVHALASSSPWNCDYPAGMWVRALGLADNAEPDSARSAVSKVMKRLEDRQLVERKRVGRTSSIRLLKEDGSGDPYEHPHTAQANETWLQLPHSYWSDRYHLSLSLPGKAMLLVGLSRPDGFVLPYDRAPDWYGISPDSAERGLRELAHAGVLEYEQRWVKNHRSDTGWIEQRHYTFIGPFSEAARKDAAAQVKGRRRSLSGDRAS